MLLPVGGSKVSVAPLTKPLPLIVRVWREVDPGIDEGETLEIDGAADAMDPTTKNRIAIAVRGRAIRSSPTWIQHRSFPSLGGLKPEEKWNFW